MSGTKLDVLWSPVHHDKFIIWGSDITLYEVSRLKDIDKKTPYVSISSTRGATVLASQSANGVRCIDISAIPEQPDPLLALGLSNGHVSLAALKQTYDPLGLVGREFSPRYQRMCNAVSWSPIETNLLAVAMEKHRSDHCLLLWDVSRGSTPTEDAKFGEIATSVGEYTKPMAEMGLSETAHSVAWSSCSNRTLVSSMNLKYIKVFDLRDVSNKSVLCASSRHCLGAVCEVGGPGGVGGAGGVGGWQVASRGERVVCVWDLRAFRRPLLTLPQPRPVLRLMWCPTRRNLLMSLQRDSSTLRLHDIQQSGAPPITFPSSVPLEMQASPAVEAEVEEAERGPTAIERDVAPAPPAAPAAPATPPALAACCWHPAHPARLLAITTNEMMMDYTVCERVTVSWGGGPLVWSGAGGGALRLAPGSRPAPRPAPRRDTPHAAPPPPPPELDDISFVMSKRALTDYGLKPDLWQNADLADDESLSGLWHYLALSKSLVEDGCIRNSPRKHPGVRGVVRGDGYRSEAAGALLADVPLRRVTLYRSAARAGALALCGWGWGWDGAAAGVERAEAQGTPCRAAALAAFHLRVRTALDVLARAKEPQLRVVALALAGLSDERLWRDVLRAAAPALPDAYLRALLHFLAAAAPAHLAPPSPPAAVLAETEMRLEDRLAFACIYLNDADLDDYVADLQTQLIEQGDLSGILITGVSPEGVQLLQRWVERTGDVQTAALVAARCCPPDLAQDPRVQGWLQAYRWLLDGWRLWGARAALDTWAAGEAGGGAALGVGGGAAGGAVGVACSYCGKPVAAPPAARRVRARLPPPAAKMKQLSSCPNCRKPLPRCGVCSLHLGAGGAQFAGWFSWCVACRHGGHAGHLLDWFRDHTECPVSSCNCHCSTLDPPDRL